MLTQALKERLNANVPNASNQPLTACVFINHYLPSSGRKIVHKEDIPMMSGEIDVERMMEFSRRQRGMGEWNALKEYWKASEQDKPVVRFLYGSLLTKGLERCRARN